MNRDWGNEEGRSTLKTPTSILLRPNKEFDSFGYDADDKYVHFTRGEETEYYYLKHFKMELHKAKVTCIIKVYYIRAMQTYPRAKRSKRGRNRSDESFKEKWQDPLDNESLQTISGSCRD